MAKKKLFAIILATVITTSTGLLITQNTFSSENKSNITLMNYKPAKEVNTSGYEINKYEGITAVAELNNNEILTLNSKEASAKDTKQLTGDFLSIYSLNNKKTIKEFKETNVCHFYGVSPNKKFALYEEPKYIPPDCNSDAYKNQLNSGELFHHDIKILDLVTGEIVPLNTEFNNKDAEYIWVSDTKILVNYFNKWAIIDASGKVYAEASYQGKIHDSAWISNVEVKDLGDTLEGKIYYTQNILDDRLMPVCVKLFSMDVKTKERNLIFENQHSPNADKKGNTIIMDKSVDNKETSPGHFDRSFEALILNEKGEVSKEVKLPAPNTDKFILSPDGSKAAYIEFVKTNNVPHTTTAPDGSEAICLTNETPPDVKLKIIDTKTGEIKEILSCQGTSSLYWDSTSTRLYLNSGNKFFTNSKNDTFIVDFDN